MPNRQFHFSIAVSILVIALGALITSQASVGLSLMGLGAAIAVLAFSTRRAAVQQEAPDGEPARA